MHLARHVVMTSAMKGSQVKLFSEGGTRCAWGLAENDSHRIRSFVHALNSGRVSDCKSATLLNSSPGGGAQGSCTTSCESSLADSGWLYVCSLQQQISQEPLSLAPTVLI